jgi:hypothetical protein
MKLEPNLSFFARFWMAIVCFFRIWFQPAFARQLLPIYEGEREAAAASEPGSEPESASATRPLPAAPEQAHASGLFVLSMLQREGRFLDFLQEDVAPFSDAEVGAAARVVHEGCRKVVRQYLPLEPVFQESEGAAITLAQGFDPQRVRLTGNVDGPPPFKGSLKHHGWVTTEIRLPPVPTSIDLKVLAPAEVEL